MTIQIQQLPPDLKDFLGLVSAKAQELNAKVYIVGGVVRDLILKRRIFDLDMAVSKDAIIFADELAKQLKLACVKYPRFKTATINYSGRRIDFATLRRESYPYPGSLPQVGAAGIQEDLYRRDFTINSMAVELQSSGSGKLIDQHGGLVDLKNKRVRILHQKSFIDDPTRIFRAIRFEQRLKFRIDAGTLKHIRLAVKTGALGTIHPHRLREELILLLKEEKASECVTRLNALVGFSFLETGCSLGADEFSLCRRIRNSILFYQSTFSVARTCLQDSSGVQPVVYRLSRKTGAEDTNNHGQPEWWLLYFMAITWAIRTERLLELMELWAFKKSQRLKVLHARQHGARIRSLTRKHKKHQVYESLQPLSLEAVLFYYAYLRECGVRSCIRQYLLDLRFVRLAITGDDLQNEGVQPQRLFGRVLEEVLACKLDGEVCTKEDELRFARSIALKLSKKCCR